MARSTKATTLVAGAVGLVAAGWIAERAAGLPDPLAPVVGVLAGSPERLALVLALAAGVVPARERQDRGGTAPQSETVTSRSHG